MKTLALIPLLWLALLLGGPAFATSLADIPALTARVTDTTGTLTPNQVSALEQTLAAFETRKGSQIAVLMVPTTAPEEIEQFSIRVAEKWKLGRQKVDDGVLLIVAKDDKTTRIEVGYGLEGVLTDATSSRIIREIMVPNFRQGDYDGAITAGTNAIMQVVNGEPLPAPSGAAGSRQGAPQQLWVIGFFLALVVGSVLRSAVGKLPAAIIVGIGAAVITWFLASAVLTALAVGVLALILTLSGVGLGHGMGGYYGGRHGGGGFGGGFGGGGGGFGGGGASGRW